MNCGIVPASTPLSCELALELRSYPMCLCKRFSPPFSFFLMHEFLPRLKTHNILQVPTFGQALFRCQPSWPRKVFDSTAALYTWISPQMMTVSAEAVQIKLRCLLKGICWNPDGQSVVGFPVNTSESNSKHYQTPYLRTIANCERCSLDENRGMSSSLFYWCPWLPG